MGHRISAGSGNATSVSVWDTGVNTPTIHATTNITVAQNATVYSEPFTAPNTSNYSTGVLVYCAVVPTGSANLTFALQEYNGSTWTTKASQVISRSALTLNSAAINWMYIRWTSAYQWNTTASNYYRIAITNDNVAGTAPQFAATSGGSNFAFLATDDQHPALAATDIYWIAGNNAGNTVTVLQDANFSATGGSNAVPASLGRSLGNALYVVSYGIFSPTTDASTTLTLKGNFYGTNGGQWLIGSIETPFPAAYTHTITIQQVTPANSESNLNYDPRFTVKWYGQVKTNWRTKYASGEGTTASPLVLNDDNAALQWNVNDEMFIGASANKADSVRKYIKTIVSTTPLTVTLSATAGGVESGLSAAYTTDSWIVNNNKNIIVQSSNLSYFYCIAYGGSVGSATYTMAGQSYVDIRGVGFSNQVSTSGSPARYGYIGVSGGSLASPVIPLQYCSWKNLLSGTNAVQNSQGGPSYQKYIGLVLWGSDSTYSGALVSPNNSYFNTYIDCMAFRGGNVFGPYNTNGTYTRCVAISCSGGFASYSLGANNTFTDCEAHCCDAGVYAGSINATFVGGEFGTKGANAADISVLTNYFNPNGLFDNTKFGSPTTLTGNSNWLPKSSLYIQKKSQVDADEFYDPYGNWYTDGGSLLSSPAGQADQATYAYKILTQVVAGFKIYVAAVLQILDAAYYAGVNTLPQLLLSADLDATIATGTAVATTAIQSLGVIVTPTTNINPISAVFCLETDAVTPNNQVRWSALQANLRAIGYQFIETHVNPLYKPSRDAVLSIGTPVDDPFWLERNAGILAGWSSLFTIDHGAQTITVSASATAYQLYDYAGYDLTLDANRGVSVWYTTIDGKQDACAYSLVVANGAVLSGDGKKLTLAVGKTLTLNGSGNVTFPVTTDSGTRVPITVSGLADGSRVRIQRLADGSLLAGGISSGTTFTAYQVVTDDIPVLVRIRKGAAAPKYLPYEAQGTVTLSGLALVAAQVPDPIAESTFDPNLGLTTDWTAKRLRMAAPFTSVTVQALVNFCRAEEDTDGGIAFDHIIDATGKQALSQTVAVGVTCTLRSTWQIEWYAGNYTASIGGGNLVSETGDTVAYVENGPQVEITLSAAATIVTIGSGLSTEEHDLLVATRDYAGIAAVNSQV